MPGPKYKRKTNRSSWSEDDMRRALKAITEKRVSIRKAAKLFNVPYGTLQDRLRGRFNPKKYKLGRKSVFSEEQESDLAEHILNLSKAFYGLTANSIRNLAYQYAEVNQLKHNFNQDKKMCGKDWLYSFMRRNPQLSFRKPEATSLTRVLAFNKEEVDLFFNNLEQTYGKYDLGAHRIFNVDETGISNVHVPSRIVAKKGLKQVGAVTSGERGQLVTVVAAMSAAGQYIPPMFIFKRKRMKEGLQKNGPTDAIYRCSKSGWITEELFADWIKHFAVYTKASKEDPVLLIMDNHSTHSSLETYNFCRDNGIIIVSLPPHTSHRLQPLDVTFFGPLKTAYNQECDRYIKAKQHEKILQTDIAELFKNAYNRTATLEKAMRGFEVTGIFPFNRFIFSDEELVTSSKTPEADVQTPGPSGISARNGAHTATKRKRNDIDSDIDSDSDSELVLEEIVETDVSNDEDKTLQPKQGNRSFSDLLPVPKMKTRSDEKGKTPKTQHSKIMTSTPLKEELEKKEQRKKIKLENVDKTKRTIFTERKSDNVEKKKRNITTERKQKTKEEEKCSVCQAFGRENELWWRCRSCGSWAHADCTDIEEAKDYICSKC